MVWRVEFDAAAAKELSKLDAAVKKRILEYALYKLSTSTNPRLLGQALKGTKLGEFWKYRVGNYRLICRIEDARITIMVLRVGHRKEVYR